MNNPTKLFLVGGDKGGVGKTTVSRLVYDFYKERDVSVFVFDTEYPLGNIVRFVKSCRIIDIERISDQVLLFDSVLGTKNSVVVVDIKAGVTTRLLELLDQIEFFSEARRGFVDLTFVHVLGASVASRRESPQIKKYSDKMNYVTVYNKINNSQTISYDQGVEADIYVDKLDELVYEEIDRIGICLTDFISPEAGAKISFVMRGYARSWFNSVKAQMNTLPVFA